MAKISTYTVVSPNSDDKIIISETSGTPSDVTKNITIEGLKTFINEDFTLQTTITNGNTYQASPSDALWVWGSNELTITSTSFTSFLSGKRFKTTFIEDGSYTDVLPNQLVFNNALGNETSITPNTLLSSNIDLQWPSSSGTLALTTDIPAPTPYKSYVCLLNQSGTNPPVAVVLENSLGVPISPNPWARQQAGIYNLIAPGIVATFPINKTIAFLNNGLSPTISNNIRWERVSNDEVEIVVSTGDNYLVNASFEVRVYD